MTTAELKTTNDGQATRAYLINVADTLERTIIPALEGTARSRAKDCVSIVTRLAAQATGPKTVAPECLAGLDHAGIRDAVEAVGAAIDSEESEVAALRATITDSNTDGQRCFDRARLESYLRAHPMGGPQTKIAVAKSLDGGRSKLTVMITQRGAVGLPEHIVLRQDWANSPVGTSVTPEFAMLKHLHGAGLLVPEPYLLETSEDALGAPFIIVGRLDGHIDGDIFDPPQSEELALQFAGQLGRIHSLGDGPFAGLPGIVERSFSAEQLNTELDSIEATIAQFDQPSATVAAGCAWVRSHIGDLDGQRVLAHGDFGFHNFLVQDGKLSALLDWELAHLGYPAEDLGYVQSWVRKMMPWDRFLMAYHAAGGPESTQVAVDFYTIWASLRLYAMLLQARAGIIGGVLRDCEITLCVVHYIPLLLHRMSLSLREIQARG